MQKPPWFFIKPTQVPARQASCQSSDSGEMERELDRPATDLAREARQAAHAVLTGQATGYTLEQKRRLVLLLAWQVQATTPFREIGEKNDPSDLPKHTGPVDPTALHFHSRHNER